MIEEHKHQCPACHIVQGGVAWTREKDIGRGPEAGCILICGACMAVALYNKNLEPELVTPEQLEYMEKIRPGTKAQIAQVQTDIRLINLNHDIHKSHSNVKARDN